MFYKYRLVWWAWNYPYFPFFFGCNFTCVWKWRYIWNCIPKKIHIFKQGLLYIYSSTTVLTGNKKGNKKDGSPQIIILPVSTTGFNYFLASFLAFQSFSISRYGNFSVKPFEYFNDTPGIVTYSHIKVTV